MITTKNIPQEIIDCTYYTNGTMGVDLWKLAHTEAGAKDLKKLIDSLENYK